MGNRTQLLLVAFCLSAVLLELAVAKEIKKRSEEDEEEEEEAHDNISGSDYFDGALSNDPTTPKYVVKVDIPRFLGTHIQKVSGQSIPPKGYGAKWNEFAAIWLLSGNGASFKYKPYDGDDDTTPVIDATHLFSPCSVTDGQTYIVARPRDPQKHAESIIYDQVEKGALLTAKSTKTVLIYTYLHPCGDCATKEIIPIKKAMAKVYTTARFVLLWSEEFTGMSKEDARRAQSNLKQNGIEVMQLS